METVKDRMTSRCCASAVVVCCLAGCVRHDSTRDAWDGDILPVMDSQSLKVSIDPAGLNSPPIVLQPKLRIGTGRKGETDEFGWVAGIAVDGLYRVFVADPLSYRIRVYDSNGAFVRDIGRKGHGPGEFSALHGEGDGRAANGIALVGDTLLAIDENLVALDTTGRYLWATQGQVFSTAVGITAVGSMVGIVRISRHEDGLADYSFSEYDPSSQAEHAIAHFSERNIGFEHKGLLYRRPTPLQPIAYTVDSAGQVYVVNGDSFNISVIAHGRIVRAYVSKVPRVPVTKRDIADVGDDVQELIQNAVGNVTVPDYREMIKRGPKLAYRQTIAGLVVSDRGTMLLQRMDVSEAPYNRFTSGPGIVWAMVDSAGRPLANYLLPKDFRAKVLKGCDLYGVEETGDGAQVVVQYDLTTARSSHC